MAEGLSRRLPSWMVDARTASGGTNHTNTTKRRHHADAVQQKQNQNQKPTTKMSKRKVQTCDAIAFTGSESAANGNNKKRRKPGKEFASNSQEFDLTVEDLVSIAQQYVKEDKEARTVHSDPEFPASDLETSSAPNMCKSSAVSSSGTGDPAQDMLQLFLGPLLQKPVGHQSGAKDEAFYESKSLSHTQIGDETMPKVQMMKKKKSSLKDRVSSLLHSTEDNLLP